MAITAKLFGCVLEHALTKKINWTADTIKISLHTSALNPNQDTMKYQSDLTGELASGNGYATGGLTLTGKTMTYDAATNTLVLDANDVTIPQGSLTWRTAVIYDASGGSAAANPLIAYFQSDADVISTNGTTTITMPVNGIVRLQVA